jgi:hypothetical protein
MRNWLRGRLFLFYLGFYSYRRFGLIYENDGYFVGRLKTSTYASIDLESKSFSTSYCLVGTALIRRLHFFGNFARNTISRTLSFLSINSVIGLPLLD